MTATILHGDNLAILPTLDDCSVDAIVTDPPYELGFMGKRWDATGIAYSIDLWRECLRVLKPGGHLLAFGGTRTYHRMACAIEDAGFEVRDSIHWLYGSGFPKSLDVSKAIDKAAGAEREVVGEKKAVPGVAFTSEGPNVLTITAPATDAAKQWEGWGTALKPAHEPIVVARKPLAGTVAANVLAHGTGALNIDGCRVALVGDENMAAVQAPSKSSFSAAASDWTTSTYKPTGRWPANVIIDDTIAAAHPDWAPYFYCAKPSKAERNAGLDGLPELPSRSDVGMGAVTAKNWGDSDEVVYERKTAHANTHPTVKPLALMRWLVRLVTPEGGTVLDPFLGSGTTAVAAILEGVNAIGIEMTDDYLPIIEGRIAWAEQNRIDYQQEKLPL